MRAATSAATEACGAYRVPSHGDKGAKAAAAALACPKFDAAVARLRHLRAGGGDVTTWRVTSKGAFERDAAGKRIPSPDERYIPVVYSSFDGAGLRLFSAYLTALGERHLVLRGATDSAARHAAVMAAATARYAVGTGPLAVLLHPSLSEGLSFTFNPELLVLEPVRGYGNMDQVYARVLRRFPGAPEGADADRPVKAITQLSAGWGSWRNLTGLVSSWSRYYAAATVDWSHELRHLPPTVASETYAHSSSSPDALTAAETARQGARVTALGLSLSTLDDATLGDRCEADAQKSGAPPSCTVCLRGACSCEAGEAGSKRATRSMRRSCRSLPYGKA